MLVAIIAVVGLSLCHLLIGLTSVCVGLATSVTAEVWLAHNFSPVWSGVVVSVCRYKRAQIPLIIHSNLIN